MSYSILVRDLTRETDGTPKLLAYDIRDRSAAETLVSVIATSYQDHGFNPATRVHWFRHAGGLREIFTWPRS
ncbi:MULTISPECIES: hypothetical protein [Methylobacterium]|uniref:hypothetical protein n=1 Tax=Methylobacterium TaxID=407 RepID=UPI00034A7C85|nr:MULTISPECIES: hypothetical protein [Methylobacterium]MBN4097296.1 hypothetical protein [Methylobacterium sp. OT2]UIN35723.1 hypothetical protein LXM90_04285 [Methylobacterium oryzae]SEF43241.1 hypothetical protein SAMN04488144_101256 [Methylobacterium sp. 190mf]